MLVSSLNSLPLLYRPELPTTQLGMHLEKRVNTFLQTSGSGAGEITVRVVSSSSKTIETKPGMREKYAGEFPVEMPYRTKAMFVFEEIDGEDVCFFGMHVQEYSSDCPTPNTRYTCVLQCVCVAYCSLCHPPSPPLPPPVGVCISPTWTVCTSSSRGSTGHSCITR